MLNRRLIRIKVFKVLYSSVTSGSDSLIEAEKTLNYSCEKTLHLYYFMLNAAVALRNAALTRIETGLMKFNPTPEERNPNRKFAENRVSAYLAGDPRFVKFCEDRLFQGIHGIRRVVHGGGLHPVHQDVLGPRAF